ncbi:MAG: hypothetical protein JNM27_20835 [Leptospirales bacterium]|nr:hypothetical protein [Leptospirales bacterium]
MMRWIRVSHACAVSTLLATSIVAKEPAMKDQILGSWEIHGTVYTNAPGEPETGGIGWFRRYEFKADGTYLFSAYPPLSGKGVWSIIEENGTHVLVLTEIDPEGKTIEPSTRLPISVQGNRLTLGGGELNRVP